MSEYKSISKILGECSFFFNNARSEDILQKIQAYGYDEQRLMAGVNLNKKIFGQIANIASVDGERLALSKEILQLNDEITNGFRIHIQLARMALQGKDEQLCRIPRKMNHKSYMERIFEQTKLYKAIQEQSEIKESCLKLNLSPETAIKQLEKLGQLSQMLQDRKELMAQIKRLIRERNLALNDLQKMRKDLITIARIALGEKEEQLLEKLGVVVPS